MIIYGTRFAFLSTYEWTIFLRIKDSKVKRRSRYEPEVVPCLYFSDPIHNSEFTGKFQNQYGSTQQSVSVRSALFYLIHRTGLKDSEWRIPEPLQQTYLRQYTSRNTRLEASMEAPYSKSARR
jgi:hypothetical protein